MTVTSFDTLKYATNLKKAGVAPEQAEAQAIALAEVLQTNLKDLVTKDDLKSALTELRTELKNDSGSLRTELKHDIALLSSQFKNEITSVRSEITLMKWMLGVVISVCVTILVRSFVLKAI